MKKVFAFLSVIFIFISGCEKGPDRMDDYLVEFATLLIEGKSYRFQLDNGRVLVPVAESIEKISGENGRRVILNYTPLQGHSIKINYAAPIFTDVVKLDGYPEKYSDDPIKVQSVWVSGNYLNLIMEIEYNSTPHGLALLRDSVASSVDLYLSHSRNDDPPGYPQVMYASFLLSNLRSEHDISTIPFRLFINTYTGQRVFKLEFTVPDKAPFTRLQ